MDRKWLAGIAIFVVILSVAAYFSIDRLFPKPGQTAVEPSPVPGDEREALYIPQTVGELSLVVAAESPDYELVPVSLSNQLALKSKLDSWDFWGEKKVVGFNEKGLRLDPVTAKALNILVLEQSTFTHPFKAGDLGYFRVEIDYATGVVSFYVFLGNDAFTTLDSGTLAKRISDITLTAGYLVTHPEGGVILQSASSPFVAVNK